MVRLTLCKRGLYNLARAARLGARKTVVKSVGHMGTLQAGLDALICLTPVLAFVHLQAS